MNFAIRDDDTSYFTEPDDLINIYGPIWDVCPVSLSVVPFHGCTKSGALPQKKWSGDETFPIGENKELVRFLKEMIENNKISIMLHGYSHMDSPKGYEFDAGDDLYNKVKIGKAYLEELFNTEIQVFVPPHNTLSSTGLAAVIGNNMNLVAIPSFRPNKRPLQLGNIIPFLKQKIYRWRYDKKYPYVLHYSDHKEAAYYSLTPDVPLDSLKKDFEFCHSQGGSFILATHYWEFDSHQSYDRSIRMRDVFYEFWEYVVKKDKVHFTSINKLFNN
jgi:hypothetical protein